MANKDKDKAPEELTPEQEAAKLMDVVRAGTKPKKANAGKPALKAGPDTIVVMRAPFYKLLQAMVQNQIGQAHMGQAAISKLQALLNLDTHAEAQKEWEKIRAIL